MTTTTMAPQVDQRRLISQRVVEFVREGLNRPLSEDDPEIYYPSSDGEPLAESDLQFNPLTETVHVLRRRYRNRDDVYVAGNMLMYYRMNDNGTRVAPDVFVVFGVENYPRNSYIIWREGGKSPDFVMEIASPSTYVRDMTEKREIYAGFGVTEYWRFDPTGDLFTPALEGERLVNGEYEAVASTVDATGIQRSYSAVLELEICVLPDLTLRLYDPAAGAWLRNLYEAEDALAETQDVLAETQDALAESNRHNEAQAARIRELEAQLTQHDVPSSNPSQ